MHQFIIAPLRCPVCDEISDDTSTNMQIGELPVPTKAPDHFPEPYIRVRDRLPLTFEGLQVAGFRPTRRTTDDALCYRVLQPWDCPSCGTAEQWAVLTFVVEGDGICLRSAEAVTRSREVLGLVDGVSDLIVDRDAWGEEDWLAALANAIDPG